MKKYPQTIAVGLCFGLILMCGCSGLTEIKPTPTQGAMRVSPPPISTKQPYLWPWITATPITFNSDTQQLTDVLKQYYLLDKCEIALGEQAQTKIAAPEFIEITHPFDPGEYNIWQIADNLDKSYRAYLVDEEYSCPGQTYACNLFRIYIVEQASGKVYKLNWMDDFLISRPVVMMIWVDNNMLSLLQSLAPHGVLVVGIGMNERDVVYQSIFQCP